MLPFVEPSPTSQSLVDGFDYRKIRSVATLMTLLAEVTNYAINIIWAFHTSRI